MRLKVAQKKPSPQKNIEIINIPIDNSKVIVDKIEEKDLPSESKSPDENKLTVENKPAPAKKTGLRPQFLIIYLLIAALLSYGLISVKEKKDYERNNPVTTESRSSVASTTKKTKPKKSNDETTYMNVYDDWVEPTSEETTAETTSEKASTTTAKKSETTTEEKTTDNHEVTEPTGTDPVTPTEKPTVPDETTTGEMPTGESSSELEKPSV